MRGALLADVAWLGIVGGRGAAVVGAPRGQWRRAVEAADHKCVDANGRARPCDSCRVGRGWKGVLMERDGGERGKDGGGGRWLPSTVSGVRMEGW
jgi:hypothetical protein